MKTLLAIIATPKDNEILSRHWPYFRMTGWQIIGCGPATLDPVKWPEAVSCLNTGIVGTRMTPAGSSIWGLVKQELDIIEHFLLMNAWDALCIVEADNLFVRKPIEHSCNGMYLAPILPNYAAHGIFKTPIYMSTPRMMDRKCAEIFHAHARGMFDRGDVEHWISDRFPALVCHQGKIPWMNYPAWSPLPFTWGATDAREAWIRDMQCAVKLGACCLHSVKTPEQLAAVQEVMKELGLNTQGACV